MSGIGYRIKCIRKENNLNQMQFAKSIGISQGNLSEIEMGNSNPYSQALTSIDNVYREGLPNRPAPRLNVDTRRIP